MKSLSVQYINKENNNIDRSISFFKKGRKVTVTVLENGEPKELKLDLPQVTGDSRVKDIVTLFYFYHNNPSLLAFPSGKVYKDSYDIEQDYNIVHISI